MKVTIEKYTSNELGKTTGYMEIVINVDGYPLTINNVRIVTMTSGGYFYALPSRQYTDKNGELKYTSLCGFFSKDGYREFHNAMDDAMRQFKKKQETREPEPPPKSPAQVAHEQQYDLTDDEDIPF